MSTLSYINDARSDSNDLQSLRTHPLIQEFASVDESLYELIKATNPTLRLFVDVAKKIVAGGGEE